MQSGYLIQLLLLRLRSDRRRFDMLCFIKSCSHQKQSSIVVVLLCIAFT